MAELRRLEAPSLFPGSESHKKIELARWLSDWHLIAFLQTSQLFSEVNIHSTCFYHFLTKYMGTE